MNSQDKTLGLATVAAKAMDPAQAFYMASITTFQLAATMAVNFPEHRKDMIQLSLEWLREYGKTNPLDNDNKATYLFAALEVMKPFAPADVVTDIKRAIGI